MRQVIYLKYNIIIKDEFKFQQNINADMQISKSNHINFTAVPTTGTVVPVPVWQQRLKLLVPEFFTLINNFQQPFQPYTLSHITILYTILVYIGTVCIISNKGNIKFS